MPYTVRQMNYQNSMNADSYNEDVKFNEMEDAGWTLVNSDVSSWPYVTTLWYKPKEEPPARPPGRREVKGRADG